MINMKKSIITVILSLILLIICGCTQSLNPHAPSTKTTESSPSLVPSQTAPAVNLPTTEPTVETTIPEYNPVAQDIKNFTHLFSIQYDRYAIHPENYYNTAMCCAFSCPEELPLATFFYNGFVGSHDVTDEEQAYVDDFLEAKRLEPDQMNQVLQQYFDITLDDINWDVVNICYWEKTGCYYTAGNDMLMAEDFRINKCTAAEDGTITIHYYNGYYCKDFVMTLQSRMQENEYGYYIISNLPQE